MGEGVQNAWTLFVRAMPYLVVMGIALTELPSRLLRGRYSATVPADKVTFAVRWSSAAEVMGLPLVTLAYALSSVALANTEGAESLMLPGVLVTSVAVYIVLYVCALWVVACSFTVADNELPKIVLGRARVDYRILVQGCKALGIAFSGAIDLLFAGS